jgi:hypothetical protein
MTTNNDTDDRLFVKPVRGRLVRHPRTMRPIPEEGADVTAERGYFHRMIRAGDVVVAPRPWSRRKDEEE